MLCSAVPLHYTKSNQMNIKKIVHDNELGLQHVLFLLPLVLGNLMSIEHIDAKKQRLFKTPCRQ